MKQRNINIELYRTLYYYLFYCRLLGWEIRTVKKLAKKGTKNGSKWKDVIKGGIKYINRFLR